MKKSLMLVWIISILLVSVISISLVSAESNETEVIECATSISLSFTQDVYYEGDYAKFTVEVFDSQGNKIPNYPFYPSIYEYATDHWDYASNPEMTNNEGYFEFGKTVGEGDSKGKILYKVYTEETSSCPKVEDSTEIEFRAEETVEETVQEAEEPKPMPEIPPETCAAKITIDFNQDVYYVGDEFKVVIEVFDSQGNHLPNYLFYTQAYDDGMWHSTGSDRTDERGYKIHQEIIRESEVHLFGENKFKIYTESYNNCNSVEDLATIEIRRKKATEPVPCGIGTCIPEEEPEEVEAIPENKVFYKCNGCELEDKCYPMGYRKEGQYCSDNNEFVSQIDGECDNSFECKSNVCVSGECVSEGLIKKIINWFKKLFGGEDEKPGLKMCSKLLIEKNIGDYEYIESAYGNFKESQVPLYSENGEQIGVVKCCVSGYFRNEEPGGMALVCPFDNREDIENSLKWLSARGEINLEEYKGQELYGDENAIVWTHKHFILATGFDPNANIPFPESIAEVYLDKYPNDLGEIVE